MDDNFIIPVYVVFAELCDTLLGQAKYRPKMDTAEIMTVAVVAARYFNNNLERTLIIMQMIGYIPHLHLSQRHRNRRQSA